MSQRPSRIRSPELAERICEGLASGRSLLSICSDTDFPLTAGAVRYWEQDDAEFAAQSARARAIGCHKLAEECLEIADNARNDWMTANGGDDAGWRQNGEHVQRSRLRIDTRMRLVGKWLPKIYGEKSSTEVSGPGGAPLQVEMTPTEAAARIAFVMAAAAATAKDKATNDAEENR
jgi:hypothetical protein